MYTLLPPPPPATGPPAVQRAAGPAQLLGEHPLLHPAGGRAHPGAAVAGGDHALPGDGGPEDHADRAVLHERRASVSVSWRSSVVPSEQDFG